MFSLFPGPSAIYNAFCSGASETGITRYTAPAAPSCKAEVKGRLSPPPLGASPMCASCTVGLQAVCRDGTLTIFAFCCTPVTPGCFPTDVAHHTSGMWRWQGESSCWGCGGEQLAAASALQPGGMLAGDVGDGKKRCHQERVGPPCSPSSKPICPWSSASLPKALIHVDKCQGGLIQLAWVLLGRELPPQPLIT